MSLIDNTIEQQTVNNNPFINASCPMLSKEYNELIYKIGSTLPRPKAPQHIYKMEDIDKFKYMTTQPFGC